MQVTGNNIAKEHGTAQSIDLISQSFSIDCSTLYNLSIREFPNGFCLCVQNSTNNECIAIKSIPKLDYTDPLLAIEYKKVSFSKHSIFSLVPKAISIDLDIKSFIPTTKDAKQRIIAKTNIIDDEIIIAFDAKHFHSLKENIEFIHPITNLIQLTNTFNAHNVCLFEQDGKNIYAVIKINNKIILANSYLYETTEDAAYYILAIYQQLNIDVYSHPTYLCGINDHIQNTKEFVSEYINTVKIVEPNDEFQWNKSFSNELYPIFASQLTTNI